MRVGGKDVEAPSCLRPGGDPEQLPEPPVRAGDDFAKYEKAYGAGSRNQFGGHAYDAIVVLRRSVPVALKKAKPGTPEFRAALRDAVETMGRTVFSHGVMNWTKDRPLGLHHETGVMLRASRSSTAKFVELNGELGLPPGPGLQKGLPDGPGRMDASILALMARPTARSTRCWPGHGAGVRRHAGDLHPAGRVRRLRRADAHALLQLGKVPGTVWLLLVLALRRRRASTAWRRRGPRRRAPGGHALRIARSPAAAAGGHLPGRAAPRTSAAGAGAADAGDWSRPSAR